mmetsp:Transcript_26023/g.25245  ORF Transcript_26023/g.25245 Transcript_26023/m.25245 type:complete len:87 (+) Transcript_26023:244-504(+)
MIYFDTNSLEIKDKIIDALWPFFPENQHFLVANGEKIGQFKQSNVELYGPIWIFVTMIIELCVISHLQGAIKMELDDKDTDAAMTK